MQAQQYVLAKLAETEFVMVQTNRIDVYGRYVGHVFYALKPVEPRGAEEEPGVGVQRRLLPQPRARGQRVGARHLSGGEVAEDAGCLGSGRDAGKKSGQRRQAGMNPATTPTTEPRCGRLRMKSGQSRRAGMNPATTPTTEPRCGRLRTLRRFSGLAQRVAFRPSAAAERSRPSVSDIVVGHFGPDIGAGWDIVAGADRVSETSGRPVSQ